MSKLEDRFESELIKRNIKYEKQKPMPVTEFPWKKSTSKSPKCDFYLPEIDLYIEVKGYMTLESMFKIYYLMNSSSMNYYLFQGTEYRWIDHKEMSNSSRLEKSILDQISDIERVVKGSLSVKHLCLASFSSLVSFVSDWKQEYKKYKLNLLGE